MFLAVVLAVLATLLLAEGAQSQPVTHAVARTLLVFGGAGLVTLAAAVISVSTARALNSDARDKHRLLRSFDRWQVVHAVLWLGVTIWIQAGLGWPRLVRFNLGLDHSVLIDELLVLLPMALPLMLSWAVFFEVELTVGQRGTPHLASRRFWRERMQFVSVRSRHYFGLVVLPVLILLTLRDVAHRWLPGILQGPYAQILFAAAIVAVMVGYPILLRFVWSTRVLSEGPLRQRLESFGSRSGVSFRNILLWNTRGASDNAAIMGLLPPIRYVLLSDGLLNRFTDEEVEAVFAHEVGHARQYHVLLRMMAVVAPFCVFQSLAVAAASTWAATPPYLSVAAIAYLVFGFGRYARLLEHEADLWACQHLAVQSDRSDQGTFHGIRRFTGAMKKLSETTAMDWDTGGWLHPSLRSRIEFLERTSSDPAQRSAFKRTSRRVVIAMVLAIVLPLVHIAVGMG